MNILLTFGEKDRKKNGWEWFDVLNNGEDVSKLLGFIESSTVDKLVSEHVIDRISPENVDNALESWKRLLCRGGEITLVVTDFEEVARKYIEGELEVDVLNARLAGRQSIHTLWKLSNVLRSMGFKIVTARNEGLAAVIVARKI